MASPFKFFRKYQTWFYVVLGVFLMFAFVIADPLMTLLGVSGPPSRPGAPGAAVAVRWKGGELTQNQLARRMQAEYAVQDLLQMLEKTARDRGGMPRTSLIRPLRDEQELVMRILLADRARQLGMIVNDEAIYDYLDLVSDRVYKSREAYDALLLRIVKSQGARGRLSTGEVLAQLRTDLLAERYQIVALGGLLTPSLAELWELHQKLRRQIVCDIFPFPRDDFLAQTGTPSQEALRQLFQEGKERYPDPRSPEPGFKIRRKARFGYFVAEFDTFLEAEAKKFREQVTEEEIKEYYDTNKRQFRELDLPPAQDAPTEDAQDRTKHKGKESPNKETSGEGKTPGQAAPMKETPPADGAEKKTPSKSNGDAKPASPGRNGNVAPPAKESKAEQDAKKDTKKKTGEQPPQEEEKRAPPATNPPEKQSSVGRFPPGYRVSFQEDEPAPSSPEAGPTKKDPPAPRKEPNEGGQPEPKPQAASEKTAEKKTPEKKKEAEPNTETTGAAPDKQKKQARSEKGKPKEPEQKGAEKNVPPKKTEPSSPGTDGKPQAGGESGANEPKPIRYKPLDDKLKEEIRDLIAREKAQPIAGRKVRRAISAVRRVVTEYHRTLGLAQRRKQPLPDPPDFEALAKKHGLNYRMTDAVDLLEIQRLATAPPDAEGADAPDLFRAREFRFQPQFAQIGFLDLAADFLLGPIENVSPYRPVLISHGPSMSPEVGFTPSKVFLFWVASFERERVPSFDEAKDEVARVWKAREAFKLAEKAAKELVARADSAKKPLAEAVEESERARLVTTLPFSWLTQGPAGLGGGARLSDVVGSTPDNKSVTFENLGEEFMKTVFGLKEGQRAATHDFPRVRAFAVQHKRDAKSPEQIRELFLVSDVHQRLMGLTVPERSRMIQEWYNNLAKEYQLQWSTTSSDDGA